MRKNLTNYGHIAQWLVQCSHKASVVGSNPTVSTKKEKIMGHKKEIDKLNVQKERLKVVFNRLLDTEIAIMQFQLTLASEAEHIKGIKKVIKDSEKAKKIVTSITHYEILVSLYNAFVNGKESFYVMFSATINAKNKVTYWDRTKKGFQEFIKLEQEAKAQSQKDYEERLEQQEIIKKAKEEGKKIEMVFQDGKLKPIVVEEKSN